jgi:O-methyltransferase
LFYVHPDLAAGVTQAIDTLARSFQYTFSGDMLITFQRNMGFHEDARFMQAFNAEAGDEQEKSLVWRLHVLCWCARNCLRREGDFVECGVYRGFSTAVAARYLDFGSRAKQWYLYDTFSGIPADQLNPGADHPDVYQAQDLYESCRARFAQYANVHVIRGRVPEILRERAPDKVAFLHLDMNSALAESAALEFFAERFSPGAMVLMDDYGWRAYRPQKLAADAFFGKRDCPIVELPTGQGLAVL